MFRLRTTGGGKLHPAAPELCDQLARGEIGRRDFLRTTAWLGVSVASAVTFADAIAGLVPLAMADVPKKGGVLRCALQVPDLGDPSAATSIEASMIYRHSLEFLTKVDADNVTHPYLAESWEPSADLKTWKFKLQPNVKWSNGDSFTTEDIVFTIGRWLAPDSKSPNKSAFSSLRQIEIGGPLEFTLHLDRPVLAIPEMLFANTCAILHRDFDKTGGNWTKNPIGTGPFQMVEYGAGQKAFFRRRGDYWGTAPNLDELRFIDLGPEIQAHVAALAAGQVDVVPRLTVGDIDLVKKLPDVSLLTTHAAQTLCLRMQCDQKPFDDKRVRQAVVLCADPKKMLDLAYRGYGVLGENHHVAPFQPDYFKLPALKRDVAQAKKLLADAGYTDGIDLSIMVGNTQGRWEQDTAQVLARNCAEAGIRLRLNVVSASEYWPVWDKTPFSVTFWAHRPLGVMTLDFAYRSTGAWNESHFRNKDFDAALDHAMSIIDPKARSAAMESVEKILQDDCVMAQPYWADKFAAVSGKVKGYRPHPAGYQDTYTTWLA
jgi:peptide/nickel transport system substrate-binding protein